MLYSPNRIQIFSHSIDLICYDSQSKMETELSDGLDIILFSGNFGWNLMLKHLVGWHALHYGKS